MHQRDGNARAVAGDGPDALHFVSAGIVVEHRVTLDELPFRGSEVDVVLASRRHRRLVLDAQRRRIPVLVVIRPQLIVGLGNGKLPLLPVAQIAHDDLRQATLALVPDEVIGEEIDVEEHDVVAVRYHLRPVLLARRPDGRRHQAEVATRGVGANVEKAAAVIDVVLVSCLSRLHQRRRGKGVAGGQEPHLRRGVRHGGDEHEVAGARAPLVEVEPLVRLFVEKVVLRRADRVPVDLVGALGDRVFHDVEEIPWVARPGDRVDARDPLRPVLHGAQVAHVQVVLAEAGLVGRIGEQVAVVAHVPRTELHELLALGELVHVEQHLLFGVGRSVAPRQDHVLLSLLRPRVIPVAVLRERRGGVGLLHPREHLLVELPLQALRRLHERVGVGGFRVQVLHDVRLVRKYFLA